MMAVRVVCGHDNVLGESYSQSEFALSLEQLTDIARCMARHAWTGSCQRKGRGVRCMHYHQGAV